MCIGRPSFLGRLSVADGWSPAPDVVKFAILSSFIFGFWMGRLLGFELSDTAFFMGESSALDRSADALVGETDLLNGSLLVIGNARRRPREILGLPPVGNCLKSEEGEVIRDPPSLVSGDSFAEGLLRLKGNSLARFPPVEAFDRSFGDCFELGDIFDFFAKVISGSSPESSASSDSEEVFPRCDSRGTLGEDICFLSDAVGGNADVATSSEYVLSSASSNRKSPLTPETSLTGDPIDGLGAFVALGSSSVQGNSLFGSLVAGVDSSTVTFCEAAIAPSFVTTGAGPGSIIFSDSTAASFSAGLPGDSVDDFGFIEPLTAAMAGSTVVANS